MEKETTSCDKDGDTVSYAKPGLLIALAVASALLVMWATAVGPGTEQDSCTYVCASQSLVSQRTLYNCDEKWPMNHFPPLYPMMLGVGSLSGAAPLTVARWVGAISCAASVILIGAILYVATASLFIALLGGLSIISVGDVAIRYLFAMTEGPFIAFMLLFVFSIWRAVVDEGGGWLMVSACAAALACLTRYMGASLLLTGASVLTFLSAGPRPIRLQRTAAFVAIGGLPIAAWLIRNQLETRSAFNRPLTWYPLSAADLALACTTISRWAYPSISDRAAVWIGFLLIVIGMGVLAAIAWSNPAPLQWLLVNLILCNIAFMVISRCFFDPLVEPHGRMLSPVFTAGLLLILCAIGLNTTKTWAGIALRSIGIALVLDLLFVNARATAPILYESRVRGLGGTTRYYADSDIIRWIRHLPADVAVYTDEPEPIRLFAGHSAKYLPFLTKPLSRQPDQKFESNLTAMLNSMNGRRSAIVYFYKANHWAQDSLPRVGDMPEVYHVVMKPVLKADEGIIFEARRVAAIP